MRRHQYQRESRGDHIDELEESIRHNNLSYLYPMKASTTYDWETLLRLPPLAQAPRSLIACIFDGGHRYAALRKINAQHGPLATWPVELFPEGWLMTNHHFHTKLMTYWAKITFRQIPTSSEHISLS
jgi:hypothetical protein